MKKRFASRRFGFRRRSALTLLELVVVMVVLIALAGITLPLFDGVNNETRVSTTTASLRQLQDLILNRYAADMKGADVSYGGWSSYGLTAAPINLDGLPRSLPGTQPMLVWLFHNPASVYGSATATQNTFNPTTHLGWNGPYLVSGTATYPGLNPNAAADGFTTTFGTPFNAATGVLGDQTVIDGWGNPIVIVYISEPSSAAAYYILLSAGPGGTLDPSISTATPGTAVPATIAPATTTSPRTLHIGAYQYLYWLPLQ